jgi:PAS domain S-box-containing protein
MPLTPLPPHLPLSGTDIAFDYRTAFELAPIGLVLSRNRLMVDCNRAVLAMFHASRDALIGQSFRELYPTHAEYERTGERIVGSLDADGRYADDRIMRRTTGELFWCHVSGRAFDAKDPHASGIWSFEDLSSHRVVKQDFTGREREIAALLIEGLTSKLIGKKLGVSPRTVDVYRARLMRKVGAATTPELVHRLLSG